VGGDGFDDVEVAFVMLVDAVDFDSPRLIAGVVVHLIAPDDATGFGGAGVVELRPDRVAGGDRPNQSGD